MFSSAKPCNKKIDWSVYAVFGGQWGDEGKGKIVHTILERLTHYKITTERVSNYIKWEKTPLELMIANTNKVCVRFSGGDNAGHTMVIPSEDDTQRVKVDTHMLPSGCIIPACLMVIGPMCVVNLVNLEKELTKLENLGFTDVRNRLIVDPRCVVITSEDIELDIQRETAKGKDQIGTTCRGIGPAYEKMARRRGPFVGSPEYSDIIEAMDITLCETHTLFQMMQETKNKYDIVMEGAQSIFLDKILGVPPYVTSGPCTPETIWTTGLPRNVREMIWVVVMKAYCTYVGGLKMLEDPKYTKHLETLEQIGKIGHEIGVTTGRKRQVMPFKAKHIKDVATLFNGTDEKVIIVINKSDILDLVKQFNSTDYLVNPYLLENITGDVVGYTCVKGLMNEISEGFEKEGISASNIRWSTTPHADPAILS